MTGDLKAVLRIRDVYPGSRIPDPDFYPSRIPDPGSRIHKIVNYFSFEVLKKKIWANFQRIIELFTKKIVKDPRSGIRKKPIPDPGSRIQGSKSTQSRIPDPDPQHCLKG
jgi:hypothetical protein